MKQTRKLIITVTSVAAVLLIGLVVWYSLTYVVKADYETHIKRGVQYLSAGEYDKAIVEFQDALDMDADKPDAYIQLANVYEKKGFDLLQMQMLEDGYMRTGDADIRLMLGEKFPNSEVLAGEKKEAEPEKETPSGKKPENAGLDDNGTLTEELRVLKGTVTDAATAEVIAQATIKAYAGSSATGTPVETTSGSDGSYSMMVPSGNCHVVVEKEGFITGESDVYVASHTEKTFMELAISQNLEGNTIRIILTWAEEPKDLDSYLLGTSGTGQNVKTSFYQQKVMNANGDLIAELDRDATSGYGPETTTLYDMQGTYEFIVADFHDTGSITRSGAQIQVLRGDSIVETVSISPDASPMWYAVKIEKGRVTVVNRGYFDPSGNTNKL